MWCVVADNGEEYWVYGIWLNAEEAHKFTDEMSHNNPDIDYAVASFLGNLAPGETNGKQEDNPPT